MEINKSKNIKILDGKLLTEKFKMKGTRVKTLQFHPFANTILAGHHCGTLALYDVLYGTVTKYNVNHHSGSIRCLKISPDGTIFATAGDDKIIRIWDYSTMTVIKKLSGHSDYIRSIDFHPSKPLLVSGGDDKFVGVWNYKTGKNIAWAMAHFHYIMSVVFISDKYIASGSLDHSISVLLLNETSNNGNKKKLSLTNLLTTSLSSVIPLVKTQVIDAHSRGINYLYFDKNEKILFSGSDDKTIKSHKISTSSFQPIMSDIVLEADRTINAHEGDITCIKVVNKIIYSVGEDGLLAITKKSKSEILNIGGRIWTFDIKDDYLALGNDDGLIIYTLRENIIMSRDFTYYSIGNKLYKGISSRNIRNLSTNVRINDGRNDNLIGRIKKGLIIETISCTNNEIILNYTNNSFTKHKTSLVETDSLNETLSIGGQSLHFKGKSIIFINNKMKWGKEDVKIEDININKKYKINANDEFVYLIEEKERKEVILFHVIDKKMKSVESDDLCSSFEVNKIISTPLCKNRCELALVGIKSVQFYTFNNNNIDNDNKLIPGKSFDELLNINDSKYIQYIDRFIFLYINTKQIKYYFINNEDVGILCNNPTTMHSMFKSVEILKGTQDLEESEIRSEGNREDYLEIEDETEEHLVDEDGDDDKSKEEIASSERLTGFIELIDINNKSTLIEDLNLGEIRFRYSILNTKDESDENIIDIIEEEELPGLSPMEFLIKNNKGSVALPFIEENDKKFDLLLCEYKFDKCYKIAEKLTNSNSSLIYYKRLHDEILKYFKIIDNENSENSENKINKTKHDESIVIAENCLKKLKDQKRLFYLYLCTKQFDRLRDLDNPLVESLSQLILEDKNIFNRRETDKVRDETFFNGESEEIDDEIEEEELEEELEEIKSRGSSFETVKVQEESVLNSESEEIDNEIEEEEELEEELEEIKSRGSSFETVKVQEESVLNSESEEEEEEERMRSSEFVPEILKEEELSLAEKEEVSDNEFSNEKYVTESSSNEWENDSINYENNHSINNSIVNPSINSSIIESSTPDNLINSSVSSNEEDVSPILKNEISDTSVIGLISEEEELEDSKMLNKKNK